MSPQSQQRWYMPASVLNALWGNIMQRLAASVWKGSVKWPPQSAAQSLGSLQAHPIEGTDLIRFAEQLVKISFSTGDPTKAPDNYKAAASRGRRLTAGQRSVLVAAEYFYPGVAQDILTNRPDDDHRMTLRVIPTKGYDFALTTRGLDFFVPPSPGSENVSGPVEDERQATEDIYRHFKFRETSRRPIALPRAPATSFDPKDDSFLSIPQLTAPTGAHQLPEEWMRHAGGVDWWLSGSLYRAIIAAFPRIVASMWYEEVTWNPETLAASQAQIQRTYVERFYKPGGLNELLEERIETVLPGRLKLFVAGRPSWVTDEMRGWNPRDIMVTSDGIYFPDPGPAPKWAELVDAIEQGRAGNPVFTDSGD